MLTRTVEHSFAHVLALFFYNDLFDFETKLNLNEDVPLSSRKIAAYECFYGYVL